MYLDCGGRLEYAEKINYTQKTDQQVSVRRRYQPLQFCTAPWKIPCHLIMQLYLLKLFLNFFYTEESILGLKHNWMTITLNHLGKPEWVQLCKTGWWVGLMLWIVAKIRNSVTRLVRWFDWLKCSQHSTTNYAEKVKQRTQNWICHYTRCQSNQIEREAKPSIKARVARLICTKQSAVKKWHIFMK